MKSTSNSEHLLNPKIVENELIHFSLSVIPNVEEKRGKVSKWVDEFKSGRLTKSKEEEIKPRFLTEIFGDVLGYAFGGTSSWNTRPEFKTMVDSTKADAALGIFTLTESGVLNDVIVVVEIKDLSTDLDKTKNEKNQTAVEQGFGYAHKTNADWVIISNFKEIRLYKASFSGAFETFCLENLSTENEFKRFMMLLHRRSLMDGPKSRVDKLYELQQSMSPGFFLSNTINTDDHIVNQMWKSLKRFDGMASIDPYILANISPFNILEDYVWHYEQFKLFTLNPKIYRLLTHLQFNSDGKIEISEKLQLELVTSKVDNFEEKITYVFDRLRNSLIHQISAISNYETLEVKNSHTIGFSIRTSFHFSEDKGEGISKTIASSEDQKCDCINCQFRSLDFKSFLRKLKQKSPAKLDLAYAHYLVATDGFKKCFDIYELIISGSENDAGRRVEHIVANYNQQLLFNLISWYDDPDSEVMLKRIKSIDLDELIYSSFNSSDRDVREALKQLRDDKVALRVSQNVDELLQHLHEVKRVYDRGDGYHSIGNFTSQLHFYLCHYYLFIHNNYLANGAFTNYQKIIGNIMHGLLVSHSLTKYPYRLTHFKILHLMEATLSIQTDKLEKLLNGYKEIQAGNEDSKTYLDRLKTFLDSHFDEGIFNHISLNHLMQQFLLTSHFKETCSRIFSNYFLLLTTMEFPKEFWTNQLSASLIKFLQAQDYLHWYQLEKLGKFIKAKGFLFSAEQLKEVITLANKRNSHDTNTYTGLIRSTAKALLTWHPNVKIEDESFVYKAIADASSGSGIIRHSDLTSIFQVVSEVHQNRLREILINQLDTAFSSDCFERCIWDGVIDINLKDYFVKYVQAINKSKGQGLLAIVDHKPKYQDFIFFNFILLIRKHNVDEHDPRLNILSNLSDFDQWLLHPSNYNYDKFNPEWLIAADNPAIIGKVRNNHNVRALTFKHLQTNHSLALSEIYFSELTQ